MTFEEQLDRLLELQGQMDYYDGAYPATYKSAEKELYELKARMFNNHNLLDGEYHYWFSLSKDFFDYHQGESKFSLEMLLDRFIVGVGG